MSLRIAYLSLQATEEGQAAYSHVNEIIGGLRHMGHAVDLFSPSYATHEAPGVAGRLIEFARIQRRLLSSLASYDVVYVRTHALTCFASWLAKRAGTVVVQECNGGYSDMFHAWPVARMLKSPLVAASRAQYRDADALITVTPELVIWLESEVGRAVDLVPNGANVEVFRAGQPCCDDLPGRYAVFFGSLASWQGVGTLLEAVRQPSWPTGVRLVVVGDGAMKAEVEAAAASGVVFLGVRPQAELAGIVGGAVASFVPMNQPGRESPGSPLKLYESMACGVPVIASDLPGLGSIVREYDCGIVAGAGDAQAFAHALAQIVDRPTDAAKMGERGRAAAVAHCSWRSRALDTHKIIERAALARRL